MKQCSSCGWCNSSIAIKCKHCKSKLTPLSGNETNNVVVALLVLFIIGCVAVYAFVFAPSTGRNRQFSKPPSSIFSSAYTISVSGTQDLDFSGHYMVVTAPGKSESKSVDGKVPQSYHARGSIVSVVFQKQSVNGVLKVQIIKGGRVVSSSDTSAAYGVVSVATN